MTEHIVFLKFYAFEQADEDYSFIFNCDEIKITIGDTIVYKQLDFEGQLTEQTKKQVVTSIKKFGKEGNLVTLSFN